MFVWAFLVLLLGKNIVNDEKEGNPFKIGCDLSCILTEL